MIARKYWEHALKGSQWLLKHQNPDGSWMGLKDPKVDAFYKGSWAFMTTGQMAVAQASKNAISFIVTYQV